MESTSVIRFKNLSDRSLTLQYWYSSQLVAFRIFAKGLGTLQYNEETSPLWIGRFELKIFAEQLKTTLSLSQLFRLLIEVSRINGSPSFESASGWKFLNGVDSLFAVRSEST
eukprot:TRINITY_DN519_c0_g1_i3.p1 TRINITY_DN519_c0_g1~~TRINITY_DN519_c0_g1_i3.p1  ORF type:complete len:112 (-),score=13.95 TRINITY_DN519_c0_g1_i3:158-493(-)